MSSLFAFFGSLAVSIPSRVLASLGIGWISYAGYATAADIVMSSFQGYWSNIPVDILSYLSLAGFTTGIGLVLGAFVMRLSLTALSRLGKLT